MTGGADLGDGSGGQSITDAVTGAFSRAMLAPRLDGELGRAARHQDSCSLFLFDVDYFKTVNDAYGHLRGDEVLRQLSERITALIRPHDELFRYGGDEFVVVLPETGRTEAIRVAVALTEEIRSRTFAGDPPLHVSVSLGVATYPDDAGAAAGLLACADRRNYLAKARGRGCAVADDADTGDAATSSRLWERDDAIRAVHAFLTSVEMSTRGGMPVIGQPGAGHTRFLGEVERIARLRGFQAVTLTSDRPLVLPPPGGRSAVLLVADVAAVTRVGAATAELLAADPPPGVLAVVYAAVDGPVDCGVPSVAPVALHPWSPAGLRIWLRDALHGEASETLVSWLMSRSGGLPARAEGELERLRERGNLTRMPDRGWTVTSAALGRPRRHSQLPVSMTELVGREAERVRVAALLTTSRLITLAGPGGVGKTRLALAVATDVADDFDDGAVFLALAEAREPDEVIAEIATALGVEAVPGQQLLTNIIEYLAEVPMLLVLDNFEQVMGAADAVSELLKGAPGIKVLVTSRERLSLYGERVYQVPPLGLPNLHALPVGKAGVAKALAEFPALALFEQRAQAVDDAFVLSETTLPTVAALCHRLDGLPLAIELAAARIDRWPPNMLLSSLQNHLAALGEGPRDLPARQQTLRGAIAWSVALLDPADQRLFTELSVFAGGCTVEAAEEVTGNTRADQVSRAGSADRLAALTHKNLLIADTDPDGAVRYRMLETIRAYALECLDNAPHAEAVRRRHAARYTDLADRLAEELTGPEQIAWTVQLESERQNLREALAATLAIGEVERAARICLGLWRYWASGVHLEDGRAWFERLLAAPQRLSEPTAVKVYYAAAGLAAEREDHEAAAKLAGAGLRCAESIGDREGAAWARVALGIAADTRGDYRAAYQHHSEALAAWRDLHHPRGIPIALGNLARVTWRLGDIESAHRYADECLARERAAGNSRNVLLGLECLTGILLARQDVSGARTAIRESLALSRELDDEFGEAMAIHQSGQAAVLDGDPDEGLRLFVEALCRRQELGDRQDLAISLDSVASLLVTNDGSLAAELAAAAQGLRIRYGLPAPPDGEGQRQETEATLRATVAESLLAAAGIAGRTAPLEMIINRALDALRQRTPTRQ